MNVISHVSVGSNCDKFPSMLTFYDSLMNSLGSKRQMVISKSGQKLETTVEYTSDIAAVAYGKCFPEFWITLPLDGSASVGNGVHVAFNCKSQHQVRQTHSIALTNGGVCNGAPGLRPEYSEKYYAAFFLDPCGNKLEALFFDMGVFNYCNIL